MNQNILTHIVQTQQKFDKLQCDNNELKSILQTRQFELDKLNSFQEALKKSTSNITASDSLISECALQTSAHFKNSPLLQKPLPVLTDSEIQIKENTSPQYLLLSKMLKVFTDLALQSKESISLSDIWQCENEIRQNLYYAEDELIIPSTPEDKGWKKTYLDHQS